MNSISTFFYTIYHKLSFLSKVLINRKNNLVRKENMLFSSLNHYYSNKLDLSSVVSSCYIITAMG